MNRPIVGLEKRTGSNDRVIGTRPYCDLCGWHGRRYGLGNESLAKTEAIAHVRKHQAEKSRRS